MPTILKFRGFNIMMYTHDHEPAHVHARGQGVQAIFLLGCKGGSVRPRGSFGATPQQEAMLVGFIELNRDILCKAWEELHGDADKARLA